MAGYLLIERDMLQPYKTHGVISNPRSIGFMDYLRALRQEVFTYQPGTLRVVGVENLLLEAGADRDAVAAEIHLILASRANELEAMGGFVQVEFEWHLRFGQELAFEAGTQRISLRPLFGNVRREQEGGNVFYIAGFNLT